MGLFHFLNQNNKLEKIKELLKANADIVDVRSKAEYAGGHIANSMNIPLEDVTNHFDKWENGKKPVIFCCASGLRSGTATKKAKAAGIEAVNGGGWSSLRKIIEK